MEILSSDSARFRVIGAFRPPKSYRSLTYRGATALIATTFFFLCFLAPSALATGNCSSVPTTSISKTGFALEITGPRLRLHPVAPNGVAVPGAYLILTMDVVTERTRMLNSTLDSIIADRACPAPVSPLVSGSNFACIANGPDACMADPLVASNPSQNCPNYWVQKPCGVLLNYIRFIDLNCYAEHVNMEVDGVLVEAVNVYYSDPASSFTAVGSVRIPSQNFVDHPPITSGQEQSWAYAVDAVKFQYELFDWPWDPSNTFVQNSTYNNASFASVFYNVTLAAPSGGTMNYSAVNATRLFSYSNDEFTMFIELQPGMIVDEVGFNETGGSQYSISSPWFEQAIDFNVVTSVCHTAVGHWGHFVFDPSLGAIFYGSDPSQNSKTWLVAAILVPILVVGLAAFIFAYFRSPTLQKLLQPFSKRAENASKQHSAPSQSAQQETPPLFKGWAKASVPASV